MRAEPALPTFHPTAPSASAPAARALGALCLGAAVLALLRSRQAVVPAHCGERLPSHCGERLPAHCGERLPSHCGERLPSHAGSGAECAAQRAYFAPRPSNDVVPAHAGTHAEYPVRRLLNNVVPAQAGTHGTAALPGWPRQAAEPDALHGSPPARGRRQVADEASRTLHHAAALLALSVLLDSAVEHYRADFENPGMFAPLAASLATLFAAARAGRNDSAAALAGRDDSAAARAGRNDRAATRAGRNDRAAARAGRNDRAATTIYTTALAIGAAGTAFHLYNIWRRPGRFNWQNLFYAAPLGAPAALGLSGALGLAAGRVAGPHAATVLGMPTARALCALSGIGLAGTAAEAGLLHFRGAYHRPAMWLPVTLPPIGAAFLLRAAAGARDRLARAWLGLTALVGIAGVAFHANGIARQMGGWRNWSQNLLSGPPLPAPPSFLALALAGRAALSLEYRARPVGWAAPPSTRSATSRTARKPTEGRPTPAAPAKAQRAAHTRTGGAP